MKVKIEYKMRIFLLVVLASVMSTYSLFAQAQVDSSAPVGELPTIDYQTIGQYRIHDVEVVGIEHFDPEIIIYNSGITRGDTIAMPGTYISDAIKKLWGQGYFSDVKIVTQNLGGDSINLEILLSERSRVLRWDIEGTSGGERSALNDKLNLRSGSELSDFAIKNATDIIKEHFYDKGFLNTEVSVDYESDPIIQNGMHVTFNVEKGDKIKIKEITFSGNSELSNKQLEKSLKNTKDKHIFNMLKSSKLNHDDYEQDKVNLVDFYNSRGFRNASVVSDTIYQINDKRIGINITVDEGNKYYYRNIEWLGNSKHETDMLNRMVGIQTGDTYDRQSLLKILGIGPESSPDDISISSLYQNDGHLFFQIEPSETIVGQDSIDIEFKILEGSQATINKVSISGNQRINDEVIRRDLYIRPGDLYNRSMLMSTLRQLSQMSHFNPEALQPGINPISAELVDISFPLEEQASDQFQLSGGWGSGSFIGSVGITLNNVAIQDLFKKEAWKPYPSGKNQSLSITGQTNGTYYNAISMSFVEPWFGGEKPNSLSIGGYFSYQDDSYYSYYDYSDYSTSAYFSALGVSAGIGRRLQWPDQYFSLYNELSYQLYGLEDWDSFIMEDGYANIISFKTVISRNSVDQPLYPRRGSSFTASLEFTPPYSLFDGKDYSDEDMSDKDRYTWIEFHKWEFSSEWYYTLSANQNLVLMAKAELGVLGSYNKDKLSPFEGFDVGGDGMTGYSTYGVDIIGLRGYESSALNPYSYVSDYARVYSKYTLELRYPIVLSPASSIYGLVFAEGGNGYDGWSNFNPFTIKRSLGAGIRMYIPIVGLIGIDWGYGFDNPVGYASPSGSQLHFTMGSNF